MILSEIWNEEKIKQRLASDYATITIIDQLQAGEDVAIYKWITNYCHNLMNKTINTELLDLETLEDRVINVICHNIVQLVSYFRNMNRFINLSNGVNHSLAGANPLRQSNNDELNIVGLVRTNDSISYNSFDVMTKQQQQLFEITKILKEIYKELQQLIFTTN